MTDGSVVRFEPGEYYSSMYDTRELAGRRQQIWTVPPREMVGVDWRDAHQLAFCRDVFAQQTRLTFAENPVDDPTEYFASNNLYPPLDAWILEGIMKSFKPRRMIEIGCGFSTLVSARVNREYFDSQISLHCIEPYPQSFLMDGIDGVTDLRIEKIQDTPFPFLRCWKRTIFFSLILLIP